MARTRRSPDGMFATPGAVSQHGGSLPIYICNTCNMQVVWCESKRTGRKYLVSVSRGYLDQRFYAGHNIHKCRQPEPIPEWRPEEVSPSAQLDRAMRTLYDSIAKLEAVGDTEGAQMLREAARL